MYKIALTGGIGTGKTYLSSHFIAMGIPLFYADDEAKKIYQDPNFVQSLCCKLGTEILLPDGTVNMERLASVVFEDAEKLKMLNQMIHPWVMRKFETWASQQTSNTVMMESALVFEADLAHYFDKIIVADAPLELRIQRIRKRNPELTRDAILKRMAKQLPQEEKCRRADLVVCTGDTYREAQNL